MKNNMVYFIATMLYIAGCTFALTSYIQANFKELAEKSCPQMHEYQVEIDMDTVYVYDNGRYVDCYIIGETLNAFDEIMALDNR